MGGYFRKKSDNAPGMITIWRGIKKLGEVTEIIRKLKRKKE